MEILCTPVPELVLPSKPLTVKSSTIISSSTVRALSVQSLALLDGSLHGCGRNRFGPENLVKVLRVWKYILPKQQLPFLTVRWTGDPTLDARYIVLLPQGGSVLLDVSHRPQLPRVLMTG